MDEKYVSLILIYTTLSYDNNEISPVHVAQTVHKNCLGYFRRVKCTFMNEHIHHIIIKPTVWC